MNCPCKEELLILYRDQVIPLKRSILEEGSFEERKEHLGDIAARVFEWGMRPDETGMTPFRRLYKGEAYDDAPDAPTPISEEELRKFVKVDLRCLDNAAYFRRHFGSPSEE
ncbi:MAG: hypothetical protein GC168_00510 [Candidatus Hydrogenedens sp.]|nr:hypothetical protein [Candidatus Hydrogenedens sp.]